MANKIFKYKVVLEPLSIENSEQSTFRDALNAIPYLLYEVEQLKNGEKIVINKPGGKRNFGRLSRDDFMVFIYNPAEESLWLISHAEISDDIAIKFEHHKESALTLLKGLYRVCCGEEPNDVISDLALRDSVGIPVETVLKVYKWIWGQEDCNYPTKAGRWLSMHGLMERFDVNEEDLQR